MIYTVWRNQVLLHLVTQMLAEGESHQCRLRRRTGRASPRRSVAAMPAAILPDWFEIQAAHVVIGVSPFSTFRTERIIEIPSEIRYSATATTLPHGPRGSVKDIAIEPQFRSLRRLAFTCVEIQRFRDTESDQEKESAARRRIVRQSTHSDSDDRPSGAKSQRFRGTFTRTSAAWTSSSTHRWYFGWSGYFLRR